MSNGLRRLSGTELIKDYYGWLCELVEAKQDGKSYWLLMNALFEREFEYFVPNDDNRAFEGRNLREQFCDKHDIEYVYEYFPAGVSMLELIIGLAYRCESIMVDTLDEMEMADWFWKILSNVGFDEYTDDRFYELHGQSEVNHILNIIVNRTYERNGKGGLFPLKRSKKDQRTVELWYQLNAYLMENYYSEDVV